LDRNSTDFVVDKVVDSRGTFCPVPIIEAREAMEVMEPGQVLEVVATDLGSKADFPAFARHTGHQLLATEERDGAFVFYLRKADDPGPG
jgi:tRNA 2-thiouridine synthesizing protein A